ncbi:hypothetical protein [Microbispora sp. KK1-11]|uniref:hypothetical protein n=1 Tax=Microbispora sp. KK1-11 TaxID=2053005 RepID=UPI001157B71A|nr:hypothetical protein [Microbispora sp. KK1-11]TQS24118.1 hypothetical protein FLW16_36135 [Microbispora sp. KK1-11]
MSFIDDEDAQVQRWERAATLYLEEHKTLEQVAKEMDVDESTIRSYLANALVERRRRGREERADVKTEEIVKMRAAGLSWKQISAATGLSISGAYTRWELATKGRRAGRSRPKYLMEADRLEKND